MWLKLTDGQIGWLTFEVSSADELVEALERTRAQWEPRIAASDSIQVHLWYDDAWWNLSDDLPQFSSWLIETDRASREEARRFIKAPLAHPRWLYMAAEQMIRLLTAAASKGIDRPASSDSDRLV